jgi:uncharacterized protein YjbI with pentapeptide repeats
VSSLRRRSAAASGFLLVLVASAPADASPQRVVSGAAIVRELRAGRAVVREGVRVKGPVDLSAADSIHAVFRCRECTFDSAVRAPDASFERVVDFSGSSFTRSVNFRGATFNGPTLFRKAFDGGRIADRGTSFAERADFSLATFSDFASFSGATFTGPADFRDARFVDASFASTYFEGLAAFDRATFSGAALFDQAEFEKVARFEDAEFRKRANFSQVFFDGGELFSRAQFGDNASFLNASLATPSSVSAQFSDVVAARDLDFTFAEFTTAGDLQKNADPLANFEYLVCGGSLVFRDAEFEAGRRIVVQRMRARDLVLDVSLVSRIKREQDQQAVLEMIEESGKARGDLATANDAHYALRAERSKDYSPVGRALDYVFYRGVAGYFVRPMRPLLILVGLVAALSLATVVRARRRRQPDAPPSVALSRGTRMWVAATGRCSDFLTCFLDKLGLVRPQRSETGGSAPVGRRLESFTYRVLVVCAILGLANSNPTLRQMVETLF